MKLMAMASPAVSGLLSPQASVGRDNREVPARGGDGEPSHPRLFYDAASVGLMRRMLASDPGADSALKKRGSELLAEDFISEKTAEIGGGQQANYGAPANQMAEMSLTLGLLFHLTGDRRYADKLREAMLYYASYVRWAGPGLADRFPPWHSELDTARFSFGYAAGYDALHGVLSDADRKTIANAMVKLSVLPTLADWILPGVRVHSFDSMGHNWWGVCVSGAGLCALALLGDDPRAQEWVDAVDGGFIQWFDYPGNVLQNRVSTFEHDGPSYEGVGYTNYGVSEYLHYRFAWQNTYPRRQAPQIEPLNHLATFFLHTLYPTSKGSYSLNFNDSGLEADSTATVLLLIACGLGTQDASRYLARVHTDPRGALLSLLRLHPRPQAQGEAPTSIMYSHMGWAVMRSSWQNNATMLAMKSGYTWNHAHADAGSFILFKEGEPLIIDSGTCNYARSEYSTYYRQSRAHNVILFNGEGQSAEDIDHGCKFPGRMHSLIDGLGLKYAYADATGPTARWFSRNYRNWLWSGEVILIIDDLRAHTSGQMDWLLHHAGTYTAGSDDSITLKNGAAQAVVRMLYPASAHREETGLADHDPDKKIPYLAFHSDSQERLRQFITAICLDGGAVPEFEILRGSDYIGVRVTTRSTIEETYLNLRAIDASIHTSSAICIGDWITDAYMLHLSRPSSTDARVRRFFVSDGSYLRRGAQSFIESLTKLTACWSQGEPLEVFSDDASSSIQIGAELPPSRVCWNGQSVAATYDKDRRLISLKRPGSEVALK